MLTYHSQNRHAHPEVPMGLEEVDRWGFQPDTDRNMALHQITGFIQQLKPLDRQVILAWLDGMNAAEIAELTGLSSQNVATKVHRIKSILARNFHGVSNG